MKDTIGVIGLWHLGCVISASWARLGYEVIGIDADEEIVNNLRLGKPPLFEPGLQEGFAPNPTFGNPDIGVARGLAPLPGSMGQSPFSCFTDPSHLARCSVVFLAIDTPVDEKDLVDMSVVETALENAAPFLGNAKLLVISSQVPVGTSRRIAEKFSYLEVVYSPENLRLGEALENYLHPGHLVIGADTKKGQELALELFSPIEGERLLMDLPSAEMTKHALNAFLATSVVFAGQLAEACMVAGATMEQVTRAIKCDPRIGKKAYLNPGLGFSGGTLGRDLQVLSTLNKAQQKRSFPLFSELWTINSQRPSMFIEKAKRFKKIGMLGITYKPNTSTLRRSVPLEIAKKLKAFGAIVKIYDPGALLEEVFREGFTLEKDAYAAAENVDCLLVCTPWKEFFHLDLARLKKGMNAGNILDPHGVFCS